MVMTTVATAEEGKAIGRALVEARLAACVQILPIDSVYGWNGRIEEATERLLVCKIRLEAYEAVEAAIAARHAYDVPEIIAVPVTRGFAPFLNWIGAETAR